MGPNIYKILVLENSVVAAKRLLVLWGFLIFTLLGNIVLVLYFDRLFWLCLSFITVFIISLFYATLSRDQKDRPHEKVYQWSFIFITTLFIIDYFFLEESGAILFNVFLNMMLLLMALSFSYKKGLKERNINLSILLFLFLLLSIYLFFTLFLALEGVDELLGLNTKFVAVFLFAGIFLSWKELRAQILYLRNEKPMKESVQKDISNKTSISIETYEEIDSRLAFYFEKNKGFTSPSFSRDDLCAALSVSHQILSGYLHDYKKKNFYELLGDFRIEYAVQIMHKKPHYTLNAIRKEAGFGSRPSFISHFKRIKGMNPSEYKKTL